MVDSELEEFPGYEHHERMNKRVKAWCFVSKGKVANITRLFLALDSRKQGRW
jgi:hypothetical protein